MLFAQLKLGRIFALVGEVEAWAGSMGMRCSILGLTPAQIDGLVAAPALVTDLVLVAWDETRKARLQPEQRQEVEASRTIDDCAPAAKDRRVRVGEARARIARLGSFEPPLDLGKSWHILHFLLAGEIGLPSGDGAFLMTGQELGEDMGYGPARLHSPAETKDFSCFLDTQDSANLQARISRREFSPLYPAMRGPALDDSQDMLRNSVGHFRAPSRLPAQDVR